MNYTISAKTRYQGSMAYDSFDMSFGCDHNTKASEMTCTVSMTGGNFDSTEPQTAVLSGSEIVFNSATIVQGANLLSGGAASATPAASAAPSASAGKTTGAGLVTDASPSATGSSLLGNGTRTGTAAPAFTGAAAKFGMQGAAVLVVAGVAALSAL